MADIQSLPSQFEVGVFNDNLLSTQLDTQERVASLFNDFNIPQIQHTGNMIPKDWNTDDILKSQNLPKKEDYLTSDDPKQREIAKNAMMQDASKNVALTKGFGLPAMVRYQEGQEKFTDDHWWSEAGKTKFGFNPYKTLAENEDFYNKNVWNEYSLLGKTWRSVGTFAGRVLSKLVTGLVGMGGDLASMAWNGLEELVEAGGGPKNNFWADVSDNWLARSMEEADQYTKNQILPTYKAINYDDKGAFSKLTDPYTWTNDLADGAGFLLQFAIPSTWFGKAAVLGKAGKLGRLGRIASTGVGELPTASRLAKGIGSGLEFLTGSRNVGGIAAHAFSTTMESVAEAKEGFNATVDDLVSKGYSRHEAEQIAAEDAAGQFGLNMAILSVSNAFENKWFQQAVGNRINPFRSKINDAGLINTKPSSLAGKFFANNKWGNRLYFYGGNGAKAALMEGYWEENAQLAAQRVSRGEYMRRGDDTSSEGKLEKASGFFNQLIKQTHDASWFGRGDKEAADSIMAGAVIGVLGGTAFNKFAGSRDIPQSAEDGTPLFNEDGSRKTIRSFLPEGARKQELRENAELVAQVRNARDAWLSINMMPINLYNEDGTINEEQAAKRVEEINEKLGKVTSVMQRRMTLDKLTDQTERENLQYLLFGDYVKAHIMNGSGEALINRIRNWGLKSPDELALYGVDPEVIEDPAAWANIAQTMLDEYATIDKIRYENNTNETVEGYFQKERAIKSLIFDYIAQREAARMTADKYAALEQEFNPFKDVDTFNSYNALVARREALKHTLNNQQLDPESKTFFQSELDKTNEQITMRKESLPEHETGKTSDMAFQPGSDIDAQETAIMSTINEYLGYQYGKEDFQRAMEAFDLLIKEYSDPRTGIQKWNQVVDYWQKASSRTILEKLKGLGYDDAEISDMTPEQQLTLAEANQPKPTPEQEVQQTPQTEEAPPETYEQLRANLLSLLQATNDSVTDENLDLVADRLIDFLKGNPDALPGEITDALTKYIQARVARVKDNVTNNAPQEDTAQQTETQPTATEGDPVIEVPDKPFEDVKVENTATEEPPIIAPESDSTEVNYEGQLAANPRMRMSFDNIRPVGAGFVGYYIGPDNNWDGKTMDQLLTDPIEFPKMREIGRMTKNEVMAEIAHMYSSEPPFVITPPNQVPQSLLEEVREAYRLHEQALDNETTFKEEAEREGMRIHNNKIDNHVDGGKNSGHITIVTSNPRDLQDGKLKLEDNNLSRFNFLDNVISGRLNKDNFKMVLSLSESGNIFGLVADTNGIVMGFGEDGMPNKSGLPIFFYLDYDMFTTQNLEKRRSDVVKPPFRLAPLTATPIELHRSFIDRDVIEMLKDRIRRTTVTASFDFLTQGLLYREGTTNSYATIPQTEPSRSAADLWKNRNLREERGEIPLEDRVINGIYRRAHRIQFALLKEIGNPSRGTEIAEFHPRTIGTLINEDGQNIMNLLKVNVGGRELNFFQAAIEGNLEASNENVLTLKSLLRPDKFLVLELGTNVLVVNLKKFKKFATSDNITTEQLRSLTTLEDIRNSELNFTKSYYDNFAEVTLVPGVLGTGNDNYMRFVNNNVLSSAEPLKKTSDSQGYARINKRIALTLDESMEDLLKITNQREQENKAPEVTDVEVGTELTDSEKSGIIDADINPEEEQDFDDFTKTDC